MIRRWVTWVIGVGLNCVALAQAATLVATPETLSQRLQQFRSGDTLLLKPGVYRATIDLRNRIAESDAPSVIKGDVSGGGRVVLRGSDVLTGWRLVATGVYVHDLQKETSQVFVNGRLLQQMGGTVFDGYPENTRSAYRELHPHDGGIWPGRKPAVAWQSLPAESFWYDRSAQRLYVRTSEDLRDLSVLAEASQRERVLFLENVQFMQVQDLDIEHANTSVTNRGGALVVWQSRDVNLRGIHASWNDLIGIQLAGERVSLIKSEAMYNGQVGVSGFGSRVTVQQVKASYNNRRGFNKWWEAGGFKFIGSDDGGLRDSHVVDCLALFNRGDGIWFDWKNRDVQVARNVSAYNAGFGIHYEASSGGVIEDNLIFGNVQRGVYLSSSRASLVRHNLIAGNGGEGVVAVTDQDRRDNQGRRLDSDANRVESNVLAWNAGGAVYLSSDAGNVSNRNVFFGGGVPSRFSVNYPSPLNLPVYGLEAWFQRTGQDARSWWLNAPMPDSWVAYFKAQSTAKAPLVTLLSDARGRSSDHRLVLGRDLSSWSADPFLPEVGPRHVAP
ncbi:right-handed parallel beta-helix repeat-containing protein [Aquabacterium sp. G14]|uniref:right-handed parallel beta-helix repeat-containing protein n=1 Tax=Aquabacterium sp. G14 TaxID=3130164 RepID=UPI00309649D5